MSSIDTSGAEIASNGAARTNPLYFAAWRWHFYAGLYVVPFLMMLATTGFFMMLFTTFLPEYGDRLTVAPSGQTLTIGEQTAAALAAVPGATTVAEYTSPLSDTTPALIDVVSGEATVVLAVDPYTGKVLRQTAEGETWNAFLEKIHGTLLVGWVGDRLIEIAASLGILMLVTGLYLWWPRQGRGLSDLLIPQFSAKGRAFWKSLHQVTGFWISIVLVFFLISGLSWSGVWGEKFTQAWSTFPAEKWDNVPLSDETHASMNHEGEKSVPWTLEQTPMPESGSFAGQSVLPEGTDVNFDTLYVLGRKIGLEGRFHMTAPTSPEGVWTLNQNSMSYDGSSPTIDRTVHIDQYTGKVLADVRFADYGVAGKAMAVGIALHEGQLGLVNFALNAGFCLAVLLVCASGVIMWWKRRPAGASRLAAPPVPQSVPLARGVVLIAVGLSMLFPMLGLTLLTVLAVDLAFLTAIPGLKRAVS
jgi:uncharacterized iron-regulated membrane protein